jgi:hypothetical protein
MRPSSRFVACWLFVLSTGACGSSAADHESLGDRAYLSGDFETSLGEYRLALRQHAPNGRLRAKAAAAALHDYDLRAATEEYLALAEDDADRADEAADGLERVARAALSADDGNGLILAVTGLRELAANRALGGFAGELVAALGDAPQPADALAVLPYAAAGAPDARAQDSLMYRYALALARAGQCVPAVNVFESLVRRRRAPEVIPGAEQAAGSCALRLGRRALDRNEPSTAEVWFLRAVTNAGNRPIGRAAYVGLGDVMFARGDFFGAVEAYQRAMLGAGRGDSIAAVARERLNLIANAGTVIP